MVQTPRDPLSFAKHMWASFQFPKVKYLQGKHNDYTPPPAPHFIEWDAFLPRARGTLGPGLQVPTTKEDPGTGENIAILV